MNKAPGRIRKRYSAEQKARLLVELLKEEQTLAQLATRHGVHPNQLRQWRSQALERLPP
jgi:transposase-like protein